MGLNWNTRLHLAALVLLATVRPAVPADVSARRIRVAKELFQVVKSDLHQSAPRRCAILANWSSFAISEELARSAFGTTAHADLRAPILSITGSTPADVLDLREPVEGAFCNQDELKVYKAEKLFSVTSHQTDSAALVISSYSFPIFNSTHTKAVFVSTLSTLSWRYINLKLAEGGITRVSAFVYRKSKGHWHRTAEIVLARS